MAKVVIGVDPHKQLNAVCVIDGKGKVLAGAGSGLRWWQRPQDRLHGATDDMLATAIAT